jgi:hypothetical protein
MPGKVVVMQSVAVVSPSNAWAAGFAVERGSTTGRPVIEHWSGRLWRLVTLPPKALSAFDRVPAGSPVPPAPVIGASSARNVWVFNQTTGAWLRWDGLRWSHGLLPRRPGRADVAITSDLALARNDVWAFGGLVDRRASSHPYAAKFDGRKWEITPMPPALNLPVSAATPARNGGVWATIGYGGQILFPPQGNGGKLARWDGRRWQIMPLAAGLARHGDPTSTLAGPGHRLWVGGGITVKTSGLAEAAAHWNGSAWQMITVPARRTSANCVFRAVVPFRGGLIGLGNCFSDANPGKVWSRVWRLSAGRWIGPARPRIAGKEPVFLDAAATGKGGSVWALGFSGSVGIIALCGPAPR